MKGEKDFKQYYENWLHGFSNDELVRHEQNLSDVIDSDLFPGFLLSDEVLVLYELVRDECVRRLSMETMRAPFRG